MMAHNDNTMKNVKREPLSPPMSDCSDRDQHATSMESSSSGTKDNGDQPLDFSMKKLPTGGDVSDNSDDSCESELNNHRHRAFTNGNSYVSDSDLSKHSDDQDHSPGNSRIGEPQTALMGSLPGRPGNGGIIFPGLPPGFVPGTQNTQESISSLFPGSVFPGDPRKSLAGSNNKHTRPFKAYPKDPLSLPLGGYYGIPGFMPFPMDGQTTAAAQAMTMTSDELFNQYRQQVLKTQDDPDPRKRLLSNSHSSSNSTGSESTSVTSGTNTATPQVNKSSALHTPSTPTTMSSATTSSSSRKRGKILPDEQKDNAYWERRRKNNEAAKRSRDARRAKEDEIAIRAAFLEQENLKLRVEVAALKNETAKLRCMLYNS
ncbi:uncharacterized protein LOC135485472 [Lineus longissimus]|uniref:uncharacterized protein LOC135485472 n=1 Tax=Lineus longissimus TaxID=88925 RepID=UPI002B4F189F